jgi:hypothetical protein
LWPVFILLLDIGHTHQHSRLRSFVMDDSAANFAAGDQARLRATGLTVLLRSRPVGARRRRRSSGSSAAPRLSAVDWQALIGALLAVLGLTTRSSA